VWRGVGQLGDSHDVAPRIASAKREIEIARVGEDELRPRVLPDLLEARRRIARIQRDADLARLEYAQRGGEQGCVVSQQQGADGVVAMPVEQPAGEAVGRRVELREGGAPRRCADCDLVRIPSSLFLEARRDGPIGVRDVPAQGPNRGPRLRLRPRV
jgi:hypothetical protein